MFLYYERMTAEQQAIVNHFKDGLNTEIDHCVERLKAFEVIGNKYGEVPLPATAANGEPVLHGANVNIYWLRKYYLERLQALKNVLSVDEYREMIPRGYQ